MTSSRALLRVARRAGGTVVLRAAASAPQRWTVARRADRFIDAVPQLLGDGVFGGDCHRTRIEAGPGAQLQVRAVAATPLRAGASSLTATAITAAAGSAVFHVPGALIPHRGADHTSATRVVAAADARVFVASILVPGRAGMGERGCFRRLRLRNNVTVGGELALAEDATIEPATTPVDGSAGFWGAGAALTIVVTGPWAPSEPAWWAAHRGDGVTGAAGRLRAGALSYRGLCASLGAAQAFVDAAVLAARSLSG